MLFIIFKCYEILLLSQLLTCNCKLAPVWRETKNFDDGVDIFWDMFPIGESDICIKMISWLVNTVDTAGAWISVPIRSRPLPLLALLLCRKVTTPYTQTPDTHRHIMSKRSQRRAKYRRRWWHPQEYSSGILLRILHRAPYCMYYVLKTLQVTITWDLMN